MSGYRAAITSMRAHGMSVLRHLRDSLTTRRRIWIIGIDVGLVLVMLGALIDWHLNHRYNNDEVAQVLIQRDAGRFGALSAVTTEDTFVLKFPLYAAVNAIHLAPRDALLLINLLIFALTVTIALGGMALLRRDRSPATSSGRDFWYRHLIIGGMALWLVAEPRAFFEIIAPPSLRNLDAALGFLALAWIVSRVQIGRLTILSSLPPLFLLIPLFGSDPYWTYVIGVGVGLWATFLWFRSRTSKQSILLIAEVLVAFLGGSVFRWIISWLGVHYYSIPVGTTTAGSLPSALSQQFGMVLHLFGADFFGINFADVGRGALVLMAVNLLVVASIVLLVVLKLRSGWADADVLWVTVFAVLFLLSSVKDAASDPRYYVFVPFILLGLSVGVAVPRLGIAARLGWVAILIICLGAGVRVADVARHLAVDAVHAIQQRAPDPNARESDWIQAIESQGLTKGYGSLYTAGPVSFFSAGTANMISISCQGGHEAYFDLLVDRAWKSQRSQRSYIAVDHSADFSWLGRCTDDQLRAQFGEPAKVVVLDDERSLWVYDRDIGASLASPHWLTQLEGPVH